MSEFSRARVILLALVTLTLAIGLLPVPDHTAIACTHSKKDDGVGRKRVNIGCDSGGSSKGNNGGNSGDTGGGSGGGAQVRVKSPEEVYKEKLAAIEKANDAEMARYEAQVKQLNTAVAGGCSAGGGSTGGGGMCPTVKPPDLTPLPDPPKGVKPPTRPALPPVEAAYLAIATKLRIDAPGVGIGPDPDLSRWRMAVVGHSYWLWASGPTHLGPVSDSASGRTVSLEASLAAVTFQMGDGGVVKCSGAGTPYPGDKKGLYAKSPTCGYAYQTTSRHHPGGRYPVRAIATWNVAYTAPDGSGTIPIVVASERDLKVGELQTVIIH